MLELGKNSNFYHRKVSNLINKSDIDKTFVYGKKACETFKFLRRNKKGEIINDLKQQMTRAQLKYVEKRLNESYSRDGKVPPELYNTEFLRCIKHIPK